MKILTPRTVYSQNLAIRAKSHHNRFNGCGDIAIFGFPIWRPSAILNFRNMQIFTFCAFYNGKLHVSAKFHRDLLNGCGDIAYFFLSNIAAVRHFEFLKYANFHFLHGLRWQSANFVSICWTVAEILQIFHFHFEFVKYENLQPKSGNLYKISSQSVQRLRRNRDFLISIMAAARHFEFSKYANFHLLRGLQWQIACFCKISSWSVERLQSYYKQEIRSVEHGICPIVKFTSPSLNCAAILAIRP